MRTPLVALVAITVLGSACADKQSSCGTACVDGGSHVGSLDAGLLDAGTFDAAMIDLRPSDAALGDAALSHDAAPPGDGGAEGLSSYLRSLSGKGILSGQYADYLDTTPADEELDQVKLITAGTGKTPSILGVLFSLQGLEAVTDPVALANKWLGQGGIVLGMFSPGNPSYTAQIIGGATLGPTATNGHPIDFANLLTPGTAEYTRWYSQTEGIGVLVSQLKGIKGPVMMRMFPEFDRDEWWSVANRTPAQFIALWQQTVTYVRNAGVKNVLWVYNVGCGSLPADPSMLISSNYPGDAYVDVVSLDCYPPSITNVQGVSHDNRPAIAALTALGKPVIYAEMGAVKGDLPVQEFSGDSSVALQTIVTNFPQVVGVCVWPGTEALPAQNGMDAFMNNQKIVNLESLPTLH